MVKKLIVPLVFAFLLVVAGMGANAMHAHAATHVTHATKIVRVSCFGEGCDNYVSVPKGCNVGETVYNSKTVYDSHSNPIGTLKLFLSSNNYCHTAWGAFDDNYNVSYTLNGVDTYETGPSDAEFYNGSNLSAVCSPHIGPSQWCSAGMAGQNTNDCYHAYSSVTDEYGVGNLVTNTNTFCV